MSVEARVRASGLLRAGEPVLVLLSGGRDSVCLLDLAVRIGCDTAALHVDHGLRPDSAEDAAFCAELCAKLDVELTVRVLDGEPVGNLQAWARERRYSAARELAGPRGAAIATGHTATDQVETVLYRLAASPGRRALLGMEPRSGDVVRPLLTTTRDETAAHCREHGLPWREDPSNDSDAYARNRVRAELLPALRRLHPAADANVLRTLALLRDEAAVLDAAVGAALTDEQAALAALPPALARLCLQRLADDACGPGRPAPAIAARAGELLALGGGEGSAALDLGGGLRAVAEYGRLRFETGTPDAGGARAARDPRPRRLRRRRADLRGRRGARARRRHARPRRARGRRSRSARGGPATGCARSGSAAAARCRTSSPTGRSRAREGSGCPSSSPAARSPGCRASRPASASGSARARGGAPGWPGIRPAGRVRRLRAVLRDEAIGEIIVQADDLQHRIRELGAEISRDYAGKDLLLIGVLKGAVFFLSDLMRQIEIPCEVDFMAVASYGSSTDSSGVVRILKDLDAPLEGRDVLIVEDIVDSGLTLQYLMRTLEARKPASLEVCALLTKPERRKIETDARYIGFEIPDKFAIGYGLDYAERYRNLPYVAALTGVDG